MIQDTSCRRGPLLQLMMIKPSQAGINMDHIGIFVGVFIFEGFPCGDKCQLSRFPAMHKSNNKPDAGNCIQIGRNVCNDCFHTLIVSQKEMMAHPDNITRKDARRMV